LDFPVYLFLLQSFYVCSPAWDKDNKGFYYTKYPKKGDVPEGEEHYRRQVCYHLLGQILKKIY